MAYHDMHDRSPFLDSALQATLEKRTVELIGIGLTILGILMGLAVYSYSPEDPSWLAATDAPVQNILGVAGASFAAPIMLILGMASWSFSVFAVVWGMRLVFHRGSDRALGRLIFAPFSIAFMSLYCASLVPAASWSHSFGMGGLFGDTLLGQLLILMPFSPALNVTLVSFLVGTLFLAITLYCFGFTNREISRSLRFLMMGLVLVYATLVALLGRGAAGVSRFSTERQTMRENRTPRAPAPMSSSEPRPEEYSQSFPLPPAPDNPIFEPSPDPKFQPAKEKSGFMGLMPSLNKRNDRMPEPELVDQYSGVEIVAMPGDDRIQAKISNVIKSRVRRGQSLVVEDDHTSEAVENQSEGRSHQRLEPTVGRLSRRHPEGAQMHEEWSSIPDPMNAAEDAHAFQDDFGHEDMHYHDPSPFDRVPHDHVPNEMTPFHSSAPTHAPLEVSAAAARKVVQTPVRKKILPSSRATREAQPSLQFEDTQAQYELPPLGLLAAPVEVNTHHLSDDALEENARLLESVLDDYGVRGEIVAVRPGPVVTMYELEPAPGLKASRVIGLSDDIARSMSALSARVSTIPGKTVIGIELPNENREKVFLREILASKFFGDGNQKLPIALGKDIGGEPVVSNLAKMPHLLIAGTTGSGKSVAINTMILSLLYKLTPDECRLIMIDPKMLELSVYDGIPHLLSPVVTDPKKAVVALKWVVGEMEERYRKMSKMGVRNIDGYNSRVEDTLKKGELFSRTVQTGFDDETGEPVFETEQFEPEKMPYIVVIVDEMADLMMVAGKEIEACIQRLAQMARASGIHLIMATQRPSVDVITGTVKANFPTRISFQVTSKIDSRTILGEMGAEQLLGMGDMLYMAGGSKITRCHGPFVSDEEVEEVVSHLKAFGPPEYKSGVVDGPEEDTENSINEVLGLGGNTDGEDALYDQAVAIVLRDRKCSTSYIQRKLAIGYNKAARLVEQMEDQGLVSPANHVGKREILVPEQQ